MKNSIVLMLLALLLVNVGVTFANVTARIRLSTGGYRVDCDSVRLVTDRIHVYATPGFGGASRTVDSMDFADLPVWPTAMTMWCQLNSAQPYVLNVSPVETETSYQFNVVPPAPEVLVHEIQGIEESAGGLRVATGLRCYPMPFRSRTQVQFAMNVAGNAALEVFDAAGNLVRTLVDSRLGVGDHVVTWDGCNDAGAKVGSGVYLVRLSTDSDRTLTKLTKTE